MLRNSHAGDEVLSLEVSQGERQGPISALQRRKLKQAGNFQEDLGSSDPQNQPTTPAPQSTWTSPTNLDQMMAPTPAAPTASLGALLMGGSVGGDATDEHWSAATWAQVLVPAIGMAAAVWMGMKLKKRMQVHRADAEVQLIRNEDSPASYGSV